MSQETLISKEKIAARVAELGESISQDYGVKREVNDELIVIGILRGSIIFMADLIRVIQTPLKLEFLEASSYGSGTTTSGEVKLLRDLRGSCEGRDLLIVEDIVDTGITLDSLLGHLKLKNPRSIKIASLLYKPARKVKDVKIDYLGFEIEDHFVVGYGLDFDEKYRELPEVAILKEDKV